MSVSIDNMSPKQVIEIRRQVVDEIIATYGDKPSQYEYLEEWQNQDDIDFSMKTDNDGLNLPNTLKTMQNKTLVRVALDLGIEIPNWLHMIPVIEGFIPLEYRDFKEEFDGICKRVYDEPDNAIIKIMSCLEKLGKKICDSNEEFRPYKENGKSPDLVKHILTKLEAHSDKNIAFMLKDISENFANIAGKCQGLRNSHTGAHGTGKTIINDPDDAVLVVNSIATIALFLISRIEILERKKLRKTVPSSIQQSFDIDDNPKD